MPDHERVAERIISALEGFYFTFGGWRPFAVKRLSRILRAEYDRMGGRDYAPGIEDVREEETMP